VICTVMDVSCRLPLRPAHIDCFDGPPVPLALTARPYRLPVQPTCVPPALTTRPYCLP
jgi:hypothetical protein